MNPSVAITVAVEPEFRTLSALFGTSQDVFDNGLLYKVGVFNNQSTHLLRLGMGKQCVSRLNQYLEKNHPQMVLVTGFCGALGENVRTGEVVSPSALVNGKFETIPCEKSKDGALLTIDRVVETQVERASLARRFDAVAVDMESYWLVQECERHKIPWQVLRVALDDSSCDLPSLDESYQRDRKITSSSIAESKKRDPLKWERLNEQMIRSQKVLTLAVSQFLDNFSNHHSGDLT